MILAYLVFTFSDFITRKFTLAFYKIEKSLWNIIMLSLMMISLFFNLVCFNIVVFQLLSHVWLFSIPWIVAHQASCPSLSPRVCSNSCPLSWWYYLTISSSVIPFSSCPQFFPASGYFPMSRFFLSGGLNIEISASAPVLSMNIQDWFPLGLTGLISLLSKRLSSVFSSITVQKHQFFGTQISLCSASCIHTWLLEKL